MMHMAYVFYIYMFGFIIPVAIILTCYDKIIKTIQFTVNIQDQAIAVKQHIGVRFPSLLLVRAECVRCPWLQAET